MTFISTLITISVTCFINGQCGPVPFTYPIINQYITNCQGSNVIVGLDVLIGVALRMHAYH